MSGLDIAAFAVGGAGLLVSGGAFWYTRMQGVHTAKGATTAQEALAETTRIANESKAIAERSVAEAQRSADASEDSAASSRRSAKAAEDTASIDRAVRHDSCRPAQPEFIAAFRKDSSHGSPVFGTLTVGRDYRITAYGLFESGGQATLFGPELIRAGMPKEFHIVTLPNPHDPMKVTAVEFQFWPPVGLAGADEWTCRCGGDEEAPNGHWHFRVPIQPPPPPPATAPAWDRSPPGRRGF